MRVKNFDNFLTFLFRNNLSLANIYWVLSLLFLFIKSLLWFWLLYFLLFLRLLIFLVNWKLLCLLFLNFGFLLFSFSNLVFRLDSCLLINFFEIFNLLLLLVNFFCKVFHAILVYFFTSLGKDFSCKDKTMEGELLKDKRFSS